MDDHYAAYNPDPSQDDAGPLGYLALPLAWLLPGLGHFLIGQKARGAIFFISVHLLFALGLLFGGIRSINPPEQPIWTYTQFLTGWPMLVANFVEKNYFEPQYVGPDGQRSPAEIAYEAGYPIDPATGQPVAKDSPAAIEYAHNYIAKNPAFAFHPKVHDMGSVYCGIAGMLNLLVMFDVLLRVTGSEREKPDAKRRPAASPPSPGAAT